MNGETDAGYGGYQLRREKFGDRFLFVESDWGDAGKLGTANPMRLLPEESPTNERDLLDWIAEREVEYCAELLAAWHEDS